MAWLISLFFNRCPLVVFLTISLQTYWFSTERNTVHSARLGALVAAPRLSNGPHGCCSRSKAASPVSPTVPGIQEDSGIILSSNTRERSQSCFDMKRLRHFFPAPVSLLPSWQDVSVFYRKCHNMLQEYYSTTVIETSKAIRMIRLNLRPFWGIPRMRKSDS